MHPSWCAMISVGGAAGGHGDSTEGAARHATHLLRPSAVWSLAVQGRPEPHVVSD